MKTVIETSFRRRESSTLSENNHAMQTRSQTFRSSLLCALCVSLTLASQTDARSSAWSMRMSMPAGRYSATGAAINGILYLAGGDAGSDGQNSALQAYNPTTDSWTNLASMPAGRYGSESAVISNKLYVAGGWTHSPGLPNANLWVYDPSSNTWITKASLPSLNGSGAGGAIGNTF